MARQPPGSPVLASAARASTSTTALETCAADGTCLLACPVGIDTGKLVKELRAARARRARGAGGAAGRAALGRRSSAASRAGLRAGAAISRALGDGAAERGATAPPRRAVSAELVPEWGRRCRRRRRRRLPPTTARRAPRPSTCPPASTGSSAAIPRHRPTTTSARRCAARGAGRGLGARRAAGLDPARRRRHCCATPWSSKGYRDGAAWMANQTVDDALALDGRQASAAGRDRRQLLHPRPARVGGAAERGERRAPRGDRRSSTRSPGRASTCSPGCEIEQPARDRRRPPDLLGDATSASTPRSRGSPAALADEVVVPPTATCCGFAGDRGLPAPGADRIGDRRRGRASSRPSTSTPTSAPTAPARSA